MSMRVQTNRLSGETYYIKNISTTITFSTVHYSKCKLLIDRLCIKHSYNTGSCVLVAVVQL